MPFAVPKLEPEWVHLQETAARVVEREPSLDIDQMRTTLRDAIKYGRLRVQSDDNPNDALTWTAFHAEQRGFIGSSFAATWRIWLENGAVISWEAGLIFVTIAGKVQPIRLPRVRLADVFDLFEVPEEKPVPEEAPAEEVIASKETTPKAVSEAKFRRWYKQRYDTWPEDQKAPDRDQDYTAACKEFPGISRERFRRARNDFAKDWTEGGRPPGKSVDENLADYLAEENLAENPAENLAKKVAED
jgi:hypothetical protein